MDRERYVEHVLDVVESIPAGRVMSYGAIAVVVGVGGPRQVGQVLSRYGAAVPWWRVVHADGTPPGCHAAQAAAHYRSEATPLTGGLVPVRVDMPRASWAPGDVGGRCWDPCHGATEVPARASGATFGAAGPAGA